MRKSLHNCMSANGDRCHLCGELILRFRPKGCSFKKWKLIGPSRDHVVPKSKGGDGYASNTRPAHGFCNNVRKDDPIVLHRMYVMFQHIYPDARGYELPKKAQAQHDKFFDAMRCYPINKNIREQVQ